MKRTVAIELNHAADIVTAVIEDPTTYPEWLSLVAEVGAADPHPCDEGPAFHVTLRAQVGSLARSKRLRVVLTSSSGRAQTRDEIRHSVDLVRREVDGREHSMWAMRSEVLDAGEHSSHLSVSLSYEGELWTSLLEPVLGREIDKALSTLPAYLESTSAGMT